MLKTLCTVHEFHNRNLLKNLGIYQKELSLKFNLLGSKVDFHTLAYERQISTKHFLLDVVKVLHKEMGNHTEQFLDAHDAWCCVFWSTCETHV